MSKEFEAEEVRVFGKMRGTIRQHFRSCRKGQVDLEILSQLGEIFWSC